VPPREGNVSVKVSGMEEEEDRGVIQCAFTATVARAVLKRAESFMVDYRDVVEGIAASRQRRRRHGGALYTVPHKARERLITTLVMVLAVFVLCVY
jgi:hypothetical protein